MSVIAGRSMIASLVGTSVLLVTGACSSSSAEGPAPTEATGAMSTGAVSPSATPTSPLTSLTSTTPAEGGDAPEFSPASTSIIGRTTTSAGEDLQVRAPADTAFRLGAVVELAVTCTPASTRRVGDSVLYRLTCPTAAPGDSLFSTITYGDFDYTFSKPLA